MNFVSSNNLSLKYQRFKPLGCNNIGIRKFEFMEISLSSYMAKYFQKYNYGETTKSKLEDLNGHKVV